MSTGRPLHGKSVLDQDLGQAFAGFSGFASPAGSRDQSDSGVHKPLAIHRVRESFHDVGSDRHASGISQSGFVVPPSRGCGRTLLRRDYEPDLASFIEENLH